MPAKARNVVSKPGLTQEEALISLQSHPQFVAGTKIASIKRRGETWVAKLIESADDEGSPFPPKEDAPDKPEAFEDEGPDDGPDAPPKDEEGDDKGEKHDIEEVLDLLHKVVDALGLDGKDGEGDLDAGPEDGDLPPPPPAPPHHEKPLKPGEVPPGGTPLGAPSFASVAPKVASFTAEKQVPAGTTVKQAKAELEASFVPYRVKQIKRHGNTFRALLSVR